jgi:hypothetical protein
VRERLLGERRFASPGRHHDQIGVEAGRRGDGDRLDARVVNGGLGILLVAGVVELQPGDQVAGLRLVGVHDRRQPRPG